MFSSGAPGTEGSNGNRITLAEGPETVTATSSETNTAFETTATRLEEKYSGGEGGPVPPGAPAPEPEVIPPGPAHVIPPETMRRILKGIFTGLERVHGEHWHVDESEIDMLEPFNSAALSEWFNKISFLRESEYKATMIWAAVMGVFLASRSKAGATLIEKITEAVSRLFSRREDTKPSSQESPDSSPHPSTEKPS